MSFFSDLDVPSESQSSIQTQPQTSSFFSDLDAGQSISERPIEYPGLFPNVEGVKAFAKGAWKAIPGHKYLGGVAGALLPDIETKPEYETHKAAGQLAGTGATIAALATPIGQAVTAATAGAAGTGLVTAGLTGAIYKVLETAEKEGRMPTEDEIRKEAAMFIGFDGAATLAGQAFKVIKQNFKGPPKPPSPVEVVGQTELTPYEAAKSATEALPKESAKPGPFQEIRTTQPQKPESLRGRVTPGGQQFGIEIRTTPRHPNTEESVLQAFPYEIHSARNGGELATNLIRSQDEAAYNAVNAAYNTSRALNEQITGIDQQLAQNMQQRINMVDNSLLPTNVQEGLRKDAQELYNRLVARNEAGQILGYHPISNQQIIDTIQNIHHKMKFEFEHGEASNIYNLLLEDLEGALARRTEFAGETAAIQANRDARDLYRSWAEEFNTPAARRFRNISKEDYKSRYNFLKNPDNFNELRPILERTQEGRELIGAVRAEIVEKELGQFMQNPRAASQRELERKLRELGDVLTPEQVDHIREVFNRERATFNRRVKEQPTLLKQEKQKEALTKQAAKDTGIEPEKFWKQMDTRTGIQKIRSDLKNKPNEYGGIRDVKAREILYGGSTTPGTGRQMAERLRLSKNKDLWIELYSEPEYNQMMKALESLENKEANKEAIKKALIKVGVASGHVSKYVLLFI